MEEIFKEVSLTDITKVQIWEVEQEVQQIAFEVEEQFQHIFKSQSYTLQIDFNRFDVSAKSFPECPKLSKEQCMQPHYCSAISVAVTDLDGNLIGEEEEGYLIGEGLTIWEVDKSFLGFVVNEKFPFGSSKGYILSISHTEIKKLLEDDVYYLAQELNIEVS
ncbi:hypothetical protein [Bacillus sp. THAF10]|uniref:hypothetical protein n=1 Tax=Bacillus sp. THAF10 TaxID=2587848 RepID=UPI0012698186|nr:hypothetical protein [Bacillus sp. THAF10]